MIYPIRRIVAGIATVDGPDPLLPSTLELAARTGATLHLVHAFELPDLVWDAYARMGMAQAPALDDHTRNLRARLEAHVHAARPDVRARIEVVAGAPAPAILAAAAREEADIVVVGATRHGTLARMVLGTTAQRVIRQVGVPVLVVRGDLPQHLRRVLLTTDFSAFSAGIHELGLDVLESLFGDDEPQLRSLHVLWQGAALPLPLQHELLDETAREALAKFLGERRTRSRPVAAAVRYGDPEKEIVAEAADWGADLVVLGTHGRRAPERWFLGSVAEASTRGTLGSVLVVPARLEEQRTLPVAARNTLPAIAPTA